MSNAERLATPPLGYADGLKSMREMILENFPGAQFPYVAFERRVTTTQWRAVTMECMAEQGFPVVAQADGGIGYPTPPAGQELDLALANYTCQARFPGGL